jgi:NADH dehydrogenase
VLLAEVRRIDAVACAVEFADGERLTYDGLIVATGASHAYFGHPEWEAHAPGLKTLEDAIAIRRRVLLAFERAEREADAAREQVLLTFAIVGGGPTGVELAGTLAEIARQTLRDEYRHIDTARARVVLIEAGPTILAAFPPRLQAAGRASLTRAGVEVREGAPVTGIDAGGVSMGDERVRAGTVIWAAGVVASPLLETLDAPRDRAGRVEVRPDLSVPGHPDVFVVGDAAVFRPAGAAAPLPGVAQVAMQQARHAARNALRRLGGGATTTFAYRNYGNMAIVGRGAALADLGWARLSGPVAWLAWLFLHIYQLIGFRNRLAVMLNWAVAYVSFQRSVRLITGEGESPE